MFNRYKVAILLLFFFLMSYNPAHSAGYNISMLKYKYFQSLFPPMNHIVPSPADYTFVGEWIRRKGQSANDYNIFVKTIVYKKNRVIIWYISSLRGMADHFAGGSARLRTEDRQKAG